MQLITQLKQIFNTLLVYVISLIFSVTIIAGDTDAPAPPTNLNSAMHTTQDIYNRLNEGTLGTKRTGSFTEPKSLPGSTGKTLDDIMGIAPVADNVNGLTPAEAINGKTFWGLRTDGSWGTQTGTNLPTISVLDQNMLEGDGSGNTLSDSSFAVALSRPATQIITVNYATTDGTAIAGSDYTSTTGSLSINIGEQFASITIPVMPDIIVEGNETFNLILSNSVNADLGRTVATATILNDDGYTKIGSTGELLTTAEAVDDYSTTPWDCVYDKTAGLMWEVKTNTAGLRYKSHTYTYYTLNRLLNGGVMGVANGGVCVDSDNCDIRKYIIAVNADALCGYNDWRLPSLKELKSLVEVGSNPSIDMGYFPNSILNFPYWTYSHLHDSDSRIAAMYLDSGSYIIAEKNLQFQLHIMLVRDGQLFDIWDR